MTTTILHITSSLFALSAKHNLTGGYLVYIVLISVACYVVRCSLRLPRCLLSDAKE
jgi:hypothetical protein